MGKLNFCRYLILRFYPTREIRENSMHAKNVLQYFCYISAHDIGNDMGTR